MFKGYVSFREDIPEVLFLTDFKSCFLDGWK